MFWIRNICNRINLFFLHVKSELEEQRSHKVVTVLSIKFDLLLLVSLQCLKNIKMKVPQIGTVGQRDRFFLYILLQLNEPTTSKECVKCRFLNPLISNNGMLHIFSFLMEWLYVELFITVPAHVMVIYLFLQFLTFKHNSIKLIEKLSRRHFKNSFNIFEVLG